MTPCYKCKKGLCNQICSEFEASNCPKLEGFPYVCNACHERLGWGCGHPYSFYNARIADEKAARSGARTRRGRASTARPRTSIGSSSSLSLS